ncbi:MAG: sugar ABC transporter ATP-binding protein, partial [Butyrivibrio sp.]|nr:sugar ABC transporter ATP-binding protein [Butyrivibrio sp.]
QIMLAEYVGMSHAWVMRFIIIFMLITPYLANVLQLFSVGTLRFGMIIVWVLIFLFPGLDLYGQANGGEMSFPQSLGTFCYFYYFCLGFYISRYMRRIQKGSRELTIFVLSYLVTVWSQLFLTSRGVDYLIKPTYFGISLMALFGFDLLARVKVDEMYPSVSRLFKLMFECTAAMFFLYRPVQMLIQRYMVSVNGNYETMELVRESVMSMALKTVVLWVMTYVVTLVIAMTWRWGVKMVKESRRL